MFIGVAYWYLYLTGEDNIEVDFNLSSLASAMEAGGPMQRRSRSDSQTIIGKDPDHLPHSAGHMMSAIGKELSDDSPYTKPHAERKRLDSEQENEKV